MKRLLLVPLCLFLLAGTVYGDAFISGSTGTDGAFSATTSTVIQLPPSGIFNFTTVNVSAGATVTFKKNAANTPVYILATGDVTIAGTISVNGTDGNLGVAGSGGPGGFDGGQSLLNQHGGTGLGPGGGGGGPSSSLPSGGGGGYGSSGYTTSLSGSGGAAYGNSALQPLIGGSGGGGNYGVSYNNRYGGGGGGGAILIASSTSITVNGAINANGGGSVGVGMGSGGAIRLVSNTISGTGYAVIGGSNGLGLGRLRLEAYSVNFPNPFNSHYVSYPVSPPQPLFLPNTPTLSVTTVGGLSAPANPAGSYSTPDMWLPSTTNPVSVTVGIVATNIPAGTPITVSVIPASGGPTTYTTSLIGTTQSSTGTVNVTLPVGNYASVILLQTNYQIQTAMYWEGEKVDRVKVMAAMGKKSETVYVTESGKEIKAEMIAALLK